MSSQKNLSDIVDILLDVGRISFENGSDTSHTIRTVLAFGESLGCDSVRAAPHYSSLSVSASIGDDHITRIAFMRPTGVNLAAVLRLRHFLSAKEGERLSPEIAKTELAGIRLAVHPRGPLLIALLVAFSCAAFCKLFGGDLAAMGATLVASFAGTLLRGAMSKRGFNAYLVTFVVALVASLLAGLACVNGWSQTPEQAIIASVLFLVPGVPLINAIEDIAHGYPVVGAGRLIHALALFISIALGLVISVHFTGAVIL